YHITELLGVGGMGDVYLANDSVLNRKVALKLLPPGLTEHADRLKRFKHEALASSALNHPNIVTIHEFGSENESNFIVTEFVDGDTLRKRMSNGPASVVETLDVAIQVASALSAAHDAGIAHRDIKPENIMVRHDGLVKVLDFGLAKLTASTGPDTDKEAQTLFKTEPGMVMGTVGYMSPEQARGVHVDARTDIWSLGVIMYEMAAGRRPFEGSTQTDVLVAILNENVPMIKIYVDDSLDELGRIIDKTLAKEADERYQSAEELTADLKRFRHRLEFEAEMNRPDTSGSEVTQMLPAISTAEATSPALTEGLGSTSRKAMLNATIGLLALVSIVAVIFWRSNIFEFSPAQPAAPVPPSASDAGPVTPLRFLTYSLTVQSFTDGRYKNPFPLSGEMLFRNKDRIRLNIKAEQTGHLYILNQGPKDDYAEASYNILFPSPMTNDGLAKLGAGQEIQIPRQSWFELDAKEGTELVWLVWSVNEISELESAKRFANPQDRGRIKDTQLVTSIGSLLQQYQSTKPSVERDDNKKESQITGNGDIVVHLIKLEHH
ncbi:MAG: protein kinase, partial [Acidobacteriota bacterium]